MGNPDTMTTVPYDPAPVHPDSLPSITIEASVVFNLCFPWIVRVVLPGRFGIAMILIISIQWLKKGNLY